MNELAGILLYYGLVPSESRVFRRDGRWWVEGPLLRGRKAPSKGRLCRRRSLMLYKVMLSPTGISRPEAIHKEWSLLVQRETSLLSFPLSPQEKENCSLKLLLLGAATEISDQVSTPDLMWALYWHDPTKAAAVLQEGLKRRLTLPLAEPEKYRRHLKELQEGACTIEEDLMSQVLMSQDYYLNRAFSHAALLQNRSGASGAESARLVAHFLGESMRAFRLEGDLLRDPLGASLTAGLTHS